MKRTMVILAVMLGVSCGNRDDGAPAKKDFAYGVTELGSDGWLLSVPDGKGGLIYHHVVRSWRCPPGQPTCEPPKPTQWPHDCPGCTEDGCRCSLLACQRWCKDAGGTKPPGNYLPELDKKAFPIKAE